MKKKFLTVFPLLFVLMSAEIYAAVNTTAKSGTSQGYTINARAQWDYSTGNYVAKGDHTVTAKPKNTLTLIYNSQYVLTHKTSNFKVTQYFQPVYYNTIGGITTYGESFGITLSSPGPY